MTLDPRNKVFKVHIVFFSLDTNVHPSYRAKIALPKADEALTIVLSKYADFTSIFSPNLINKLPEYIKINNYAINLIESK